MKACRGAGTVDDGVGEFDRYGLAGNGAEAPSPGVLTCGAAEQGVFSGLDLQSPGFGRCQPGWPKR